MKRHIEKMLGVGIGVLILGGLLLLAFTLFGSFFVGLFALIAGIPLAFPMTLSAVALAFIGLLILAKIRKK